MNNNILEQELINLGFKRNDVSAEESGSNSYYYYTYEFNEECVLITNSSDENNCNFIVEFFNMENSIQYTNFYDIKLLIDILKKGVENGKKQ